MKTDQTNKRVNILQTNTQTNNNKKTNKTWSLQSTESGSSLRDLALKVLAGAAAPLLRGGNVNAKKVEKYDENSF